MQASQSFLELNSIIMWLGQSICTSCTVCTMGTPHSAPAQMTEGVSWKLMLLKWMRSGWNCPMTCFSFRFASNE